MLRTLVPRVVVFGAGALTLVLGQVMAVNPTARSTAQPAERAVAELPSWSAADAAAHPECTPSAAWPAGIPAEFVVVHDFRSELHRKIAFDTAWQRNHDDTEVNDVWVLGVCG